MTWLLMVLACGNQTVESFSTAKRRAADLPFAETFYCGCRLTAGGFDAESCGYRPRRDNVRAHRIEWEHVVPASRLGRGVTAYEHGDATCIADGQPYRGRRCAERASHRYARMVSDLYNLRPAIGELNAARSDREYGEVDGEPRAFGACDFEVGTAVEPPVGRLGDVARTYLYMQQAYDIELTDDERRTFLTWDRSDSVDERECRWARAVAAVQRNVNTVVDQRCRERGL